MQISRANVPGDEINWGSKERMRVFTSKGMKTLCLETVSGEEFTTLLNGGDIEYPDDLELERLMFEEEDE